MRPLNIFYILGEWPGCRKDSAIPSKQQVWSNPWLKYNALGDPKALYFKHTPKWDPSQLFCTLYQA